MKTNQSRMLLAGLLILLGGCAAGPKLDVKQAQALLATTEATVPTFETAMKQAIHALGVLLGEEPGALLADLSRDEPIPATPPSVPVGLASALLRRRPDVRRAERQLAAAMAGIGVQTAELFPKLSLGGTAGLQSLSASDWFTGGSRYWSAGPTVRWRIFDFARIRAQIKVVTAQQEQALATYEKAVLTSFQDVENALVAYANEQTRWKALNESVVANRRALEIANELYTTGNGDFLGVLDSERSLFSSDTGNLDAMVDWYRKVLGMTINHRSAVPAGAPHGPPFSAFAFVSNDETDHRIVLFEVPGLVADPDKARHVHLQHVAFNYEILDDLLGTYVRLKGLGILPLWAADQGVGTSFDYQDPDQNIVELNLLNYGNESTATEYMRSSPAPAARPNPVDPDKLVTARRAGASPWELHERALAGEFAPSQPHDPRTQF